MKELEICVYDEFVVLGDKPRATYEARNVLFSAVLYYEFSQEEVMGANRFGRAPSVDIFYSETVRAAA